MALIDTVQTRPVTIPTYLRGKANGRLAASDLRTFDHRGPLFLPVSFSMQALHIAAWGDQVPGFGIPAAHHDVDSVGRYRSYAQQETLFRSRYAPSPVTSRGSKVWNGVRWYNQRGAMAAVPGTSNHGWGLADDVAIDTDGDRVAESMPDVQLAWMRDYGPRFGWGLETRVERWHWHWIGGDRLPQLVVDVLHVCGIKIPDLRPFGFTVPAPTTSTARPPEVDVNWNLDDKTLASVKSAPPTADVLAGRANDWAVIALIKSCQKAWGMTVTGRWTQAFGERFNREFGYKG